MIIERTKNEILVRLSPQTNTSDLQDTLDYLEYKELISQSNANQESINKLTKSVNQSIAKTIKKSRK